jgi:hypothetical protein
LEPKYKIGQKVTVKKFKSDSSVLRDAKISQYANQGGTVTNCYSIRPNWGEAFHIYTVEMDISKKSIVLHEDEIQ